MGCLHCPSFISNYSLRWENLREFELQRRVIWKPMILLCKFSPSKRMRKLQQIQAVCLVMLRLQYPCISTLWVSCCLKLPVHLVFSQIFVIACIFLASSWLFFSDKPSVCCKVHKHAYATTEQGGGKVFVRRMLIALFNVCTICFHIKTIVQIIWIQVSNRITRKKK